MLNTAYMKKGEFGPFPYRIMEYDESTQSLVPVDLTGAAVTFSLFKAVQKTADEMTTDETGEVFKEEGFATGLSCEILNAVDGWVQGEFPSSGTVDLSRYRIEFTVSSDDFVKVYPRFADQWIRVQ